MNRTFFHLAIAATLALLAAPRLAAEELPTLRIAWAEDADALDPTLSRTYVGRILSRNRDTARQNQAENSGATVN